MRIILIIKAIALLLVCGAVGGTIYLIRDFSGSVEDLPGALMLHQREVEERLKAKAESGLNTDNEPGDKAFQRAKELLAGGSMLEAEEKLKYIVSFYPMAESAAECRRILGEMNLDRLLDPDWLEGKNIITVRSGDTFSSIISKNETTMDSLVHLSKLKRSDHLSLHPGDKLTVMPMNLRAVIDLRKKTLTLWRGGEFIKEYSILNVTYDQRATKKHCKIGLIRGSHGGNLYPSHAEQYVGSSKVMILSDKSLTIRGLKAGGGEESGRGFVLSHADMEELPLLLGPGNDVEIRN